MPEPSTFEVVMATEKLKRYQLPGNDQIPAELIKAGGRTTCSEIHKFSNSIWNKEVLPEEWKESITVLMYHKGNKTAYNFCQLHTKLYPTYCCQGILMGIISVDFNATSHLLIKYSAFVKYLRKNGNTMKQCISYL